ncbi:hypothetical protein QJS10_CPA08g01858 [Acorus calamus]|uniref:Late embryogenesis abundant protein LEA-2 subgroup domain-containing protein n=1 Tax=Acorus calamus TaxID=4465 RepID=A0AAV9EC02_ACOCL|nr:hypothetical protein QJS10_CPA08g01858 [Acorus calamus]
MKTNKYTHPFTSSSNTPPKMPPLTTPTSTFQLHHPPIQPSKQMKPKLLALPPPPAPPPPPPLKLLRPTRKTNPLVWCGAFACIIFSLLLILSGVAIIIIFVVIKPRIPSSDVTGASLNGLYIDSPEYLNADFTLLANFSNPNRRIDVRFEHLSIDLYFYDSLISARALSPFTLRGGEGRLETVHMVASEVYLSPEIAMELRRQVGTNRVVYGVRGAFRVKASIGLMRFSYWLYSRCQIEMTGPPTGVLVARRCKTRRS